jgi:hypothetical protein
MGLAHAAILPTAFITHPVSAADTHDAVLGPGGTEKRARVTLSRQTAH